MSISPRRPAVSERRPPSSDWANNTTRLVDSSNGRRRHAESLTQDARRTIGLASAQSQQVRSMVNEKITKRIKETKGMERKLQGGISMLKKEIETLKGATARVEERKKLLEKPLNKSTMRAQIRSTRPPKENIGDKVARALTAQSRTVAQMIEALQGLQERCEKQLRTMYSHLSVMQQNLEDKVNARKIDEECLQVENGEPLVDPQLTPSPPRPVKVSIGHTRVQARAEMAAAGTKSEKEMSEWKESTIYAVQCAKQLCNSSVELREKITGTIKKVAEADRTASEAVCDSLNKKVGETSRLNKLLSKQLEQIHGEMARVIREKCEVDEALRRNEEPLRVTQARVAVRKQRPPRERIRDEVEEALEQEVRSLIGLNNKLKNKQAAIAAEIESLRKMKDAVKQDYSDKCEALQRDMECLDLESTMTSSRKTTNGNSASGNGYTITEESPSLPPISSPRQV